METRNPFPDTEQQLKSAHVNEGLPLSIRLGRQHAGTGKISRLGSYIGDYIGPVTQFYNRLLREVHAKMQPELHFKLSGMDRKAFRQQSQHRMNQTAILQGKVEEAERKLPDTWKIPLLFFSLVFAVVVCLLILSSEVFYLSKAMQAVSGQNLFFSTWIAVGITVAVAIIAFIAELQIDRHVRKQWLKWCCRLLLAVGILLFLWVAANIRSSYAEQIGKGSTNEWQLTFFGFIFAATLACILRLWITPTVLRLIALWSLIALKARLKRLREEHNREEQALQERTSQRIRETNWMPTLEELIVSLYEEAVEKFKEAAMELLDFQPECFVMDPPPPLQRKYDDEAALRKLINDDESQTNDI